MGEGRIVSTGLRDRVRSAEIRDWARRNGWPGLPARGRIPDDAVRAWEAQFSAPADVGYDLIDPDGTGDPDEGDDWLAELDESGFADPDEVMTAPVSLDEARQRVADQESAHLRKGRRGVSRETAQPAPVKITPKVIGDIEGKLAFWLSLTAEPWAVADPYCGGAYAQQVPAIAKAAAPLICQSPDLVRWFGKSTTFILWTELGMAARPVISAVVKHHVTRTVRLVEGPEGGAAVAVPAGPGAADFSAYATPVPASSAA